VAEPPPFSLGFEEPGAGYVSGSQRARVFTESWVAAYLFCPNCGERRISPYVANRPRCDFSSNSSRQPAQWKSNTGRFAT
jgi:type II restriction enzyme